jgi:16S rRNA (cytidine1402-2'-O)-methyltransferase
LRHTLIFLESPHRIVDSLKDLLAGLGDRQICVAREMTKLFEEFWRGPISGALEYFKSREARGEFTLVVAGNQTVDSGQWTEEDLLAAIKRELENGKSAKEISVELAEQSGWSKKEVYARVNQAK